ncbi:hypothetical protein WA026_020571 [Henosepilachna vigintioctopunctata]|uniref:C2H2-type domain-containing protein n=1 Tax=Henosepilachna vigintioctopunctata TaxID=420089 RepID=A0AAW1UWA4_9CUCU
MRKTFKNNRCFFCPKVFCCTECRNKHESIFHKTEICQIHAKMSKPLLCNDHAEFSKSTKKPSSAVQAVTVPEIQAAESSPKTPQDSGKVEQLIMKFSRTTSITIPSNEKVENKVENNIRSNGANYEVTIPRFVPQPTKYSKSNLNEYKETQCSMDVEVSDISSFMNDSMKSKDLKLTDTPNLVQTVQNSTPPVNHKNSTVEERDNLVNEETDSKATDTILWVTANSFVDCSEENKEPVISSNYKGENSSAQYMEVPKFLRPSRNEPAGEELNATNSVSKASPNSITDLSHSVWQTITNSLRSALDTTRDICNITTNISKRSLDIIDYPSAKRRKYEPFLKCRPPIHDLGEIVMSKVNSTSISTVDKSTQTEDCYFV